MDTISICFGGKLSRQKDNDDFLISSPLWVTFVRVSEVNGELSKIKVKDATNYGPCAGVFYVSLITIASIVSSEYFKSPI